MCRLMPTLVVLAVSLSFSPVGKAAELTADQLRTCQQLEDAAQRLQCFDALAERVLGVEEAAAVAVAPAATAAAAAPTASAVEQPAASIESEPVVPAAAAVVAAEAQPEPSVNTAAEESFGRREEPEKPESIQTVIDKTDKTAYGKLVLYLDNGQVWQQLDSLRTTFKAGDEIIISSAVSGSFLLRKTTGGTRIRVKRLDV